MEGTVKIISIILFGVFLFLLERKFPLRRVTRKTYPRLLVNVALASITLVIGLLLVQSSALYFLHWSLQNQIGLLHLFEASRWMKALLTFLLLDLSFYYWHLLNHKIPFLWRFHNVHHIDPDLDVSTGFRFHFGEVAISTLFRIVQVTLIGPSLSFFLAYEMLFRLGTFFHHSNLRLPKNVDHVLNLFIVTPRMHGIHHSDFHNETDSNYSVVFSFWDRLHKTFITHINQKDITIGVPAYRLPEDNHLKKVICLPFQKQRYYWKDHESRSKEKNV